MYWSAVTTLVAKTAPTSEATSAPADFAASITGVISRSRTPAFSTTPPKASAVITSQIVFSMLSMPPRLTSTSIAAYPVSDLYPLASASHTPLTTASQSGMSSPAPPSAITRSGATTAASTPPTSAPMKIAVNGGNRSSASPTTTTSGTNSHGRDVEGALDRAASSRSRRSRPAGRAAQNTRERDRDGEHRGEGRLANVLVQVDAGGGGGEVGRVRERRGRVAEVGAGDDRAGGDRRVQVHVHRDPHEADADRADRRPGAADAERDHGADRAGGQRRSSSG